MTVLHVIPDDKFWTTIKALFDKVAVRNQYVCIINNEELKTKYVDFNAVQVISSKDAGSLWQREDIDVVVFHSIPFEYYDYILSVEGSVVVMVVSWGYDIYYPQADCPPLLPLKLYKPRTSHLLRKIEKATHQSLVKIKGRLKYFLKKDYRNQISTKKLLIQNSIRKQRTALDRIDFWATVLPPEYEMLKEQVGIKAQYVSFNYTNRYLIDEPSRIDPDSANTILVGNSADPTNNHLDIISIIKHRGIQNKLFIPAAYGSIEYRDAVIRYVESHSIDCDILTELIPREEYKRRLMDCRAAIFGHIRQQSIGNINICMLQGIKVFLYKDSIAYKFFKSIGSYVYSIEDDLYKEELLTPLTKEQNELNKKNLDWLSLDYVVPRMNHFFERMGSRTNQEHKQ